jgi:hypothetical protein
LWESQLWQFQDSHLGVPRQNAIWMGASWRCTKYTVRGKVVVSPSLGHGGSCESELPVARPSTKVFQLCTNHLVLVLCRSMWVVEACQFSLVPSRSFSTPLYPSKVLQAKERASTLCSFDVFLLGLTFGVIQGVRSTSQCMPCKVFNFFVSMLHHKMITIQKFKMCNLIHILINIYYIVLENIQIQQTLK